MDNFVDSVTGTLASLNPILIILALVLIIADFFYLRSNKDRGSLVSLIGATYLTFTILMLITFMFYAAVFTPLALVIILLGYQGNIRAAVKNKAKGTKSYSLSSVAMNIAAFVAVLMIFLFIAIFIDSCIMTRSSYSCNRS